MCHVDRTSTRLPPITVLVYRVHRTLIAQQRDLLVTLGLAGVETAVILVLAVPSKMTTEILRAALARATPYAQRLGSLVSLGLSVLVALASVSTPRKVSINKYAR